MTLPKWVQGPSKKPFIGKPCRATVYFSMSSKFSEVPYILATIQAASAFDAVKIVIPDTLEYQNMSLLPDNKNKEEQVLYKELKGNGVAFYERNKAHFQPLIDKVGQQTWDNECVTYWDDYRLTSAFKDAKIIIQTICAYEREEALEASEQQYNNGLADDANIFSLNQAIELTAQKRLNCFWNVKNKKYDLTSPEALKFIDYIQDELAQLLVEALDIKAKVDLEKKGNGSIDGHAILYAGKLNPAMYKLFQLIIARDEHKLMSKTNALLKPYKISENLMQPLSINWNAKDVKEILNQFQKSVVKQEDNNIINASHIFNSQTIVRRNSGADALAIERQSSPPDGPSFEELFKQAFSMGAEIALKYPEDPQRVRAVADYSSRFLLNTKIMFFPPLARQQILSKEENATHLVDNSTTKTALSK